MNRNELSNAVKEAIAKNDVNVLRNHLDRMLINAVRKDDLEAVESLLDIGANPNAKDEWGTPVLLYATGTNQYTNEHIEIVNKLLEYGAKSSINKEDEYGNTPFLTAVFNNDLEVVKLFLQYGANPSIKSGRGESPLSLARQMAKEYADMADSLEEQSIIVKDNATAKL